MEYSLFSGLNEAEILEIQVLSQQLTFEKNEIIFHQGDIPEALYILNEGSVYICEDSLDGHRNILTIINEKDDCFGEIFLFKNICYPYYSIAMNHTSILKIPKEILFNHPKLNVNLNHYFANKAYVLSNKLQLLMKGSLREKIIEYLCNHQDTILKRFELADYLGVSRPALSKELYRMVDEGIIEINQQGVFNILKE